MSESEVSSSFTEVPKARLNIARKVMKLQLASIAITLVCAFSGSQQVSAPIPTLPRLSGTFGIARVAYEWIDRSRLDPFSKSPQAHRALMVHVWYPTTPTREEASGVYLPGAA